MTNGLWWLLTLALYLLLDLFISSLTGNIRLPEKFLSFHEVIIDKQQFLFYTILLNYV